MPKAKKPTKTQLQIKHLNSAINALHRDVLRGQDSYIRVWNTLSIFTRTFQSHLINIGVVKDAAEFMELFRNNSTELFQEAKAHNDAEMARIKEEQTNGEEPAPMAPAGDLLSDLVQAGVEAESAACDAD